MSDASKEVVKTSLSPSDVIAAMNSGTTKRKSW